VVSKRGRICYGGAVLLAIDVGNTNTVLGLYEGEALIHHFRIATNRSATSDEMSELMLSLVERKRIDPQKITGSIVASVVPQLNRIVVDAASKSFGAGSSGEGPIVVGPGVKTGMPILIDNPLEVGADRIVNAVAGWQRHKQALVLVDFGTGTTFDAVDDKGQYLGGAIAPGIDISMDALFSRAAKLPRVELKRPPKVIGKNTIHALQSGLLFGYAGLVDEIVSRMKVELTSPTKVIATGGLAFLFEGVSRTLEIVDEFLTLDGLRILYGMNTPEKNSKK
jgi:type III pantothenate kinase